MFVLYYVPLEINTQQTVMCRYLLTITILAATMLANGCGRSSNELDVEAHRNDIEAWQKARFTRLTGENNWLTLVGLFWLKQGDNMVGSDPSSDVILPAGKTPKRLGVISVNEHGSITFRAERGTTVKLENPSDTSTSTVTSATLQDDGDGSKDPSILRIGTVSFYVIKRSNQLGVRVKDSESPTRVNFKGLEYFPINPKWRVVAKFEPYNPPRTLPITNVQGIVSDEDVPGSLVFELEGKQCRLDAIVERGSPDNLYIIFTDETTGEETYGNGRQMYTPKPNEKNEVVLDFNKAYNFPCAFTPYSTCSIPPRQNHLPLRVEAGEKTPQGVHS
jgi:uncharacterized protein (DUF1684 family)